MSPAVPTEPNSPFRKPIFLQKHLRAFSARQQACRVVSHDDATLDIHALSEPLGSLMGRCCPFMGLAERVAYVPN